MMIDIGVIKNIYDMVVYYNSQYTPKERIVLDPLTTMCKLALLAFKPIGTKIGFGENRIVIQIPTRSQWFWRTVYGNKKYQIHHLLTPIARAIKRYPISNPNIKTIFQTSIIGLEKLKLTYNNDSSTVVHSLELYIHTINEYIQTINTDDTRSRSNSILKLLEEDDNKLNILQDIWNDKTIEIIANMIRQIEDQPYDTSSYVDAIENILNNQDDKLSNKIQEITESL
jgi:hypothetical protein